VQFVRSRTTTRRAWLIYSLGPLSSDALAGYPCRARPAHSLMQDVNTASALRACEGGPSLVCARVDDDDHMRRGAISSVCSCR
jgi:hypothetical protein